MRQVKQETTMKTTLTTVSKKNARETVQLVTDADGREIGLLTKYRDTRTEWHPWKAFAGIGMSSRFLAAYYPSEGGKDAALAAVVAAVGTPSSYWANDLNN